MTLKNSLRIFEFLDKLYLIGYFLLIIAVILRITEGNYNFSLFGISIATLFVGFFRKRLFYATLQNSKYKSAFVSVADKIIEDELDETIESDFSFYKTLPCDYSTAEFIQDNKLNTHIRKKYDKSLYMIFSSNELIIQDKSISWDNVVSWKYYQRNPSGVVGSPPRIEVTVKESSSDKLHTYFIEPDKLESSPVDILLLLYHFKTYSAKNCG